MIYPARCKLKRGSDIFRVKIRKFFKNLLRGQSRGEQIQHIRHPNSHPSNTWPAATLFGPYRYAIARFVHMIAG